MISKDANRVVWVVNIEQDIRIRSRLTKQTDSGRSGFVFCRRVLLGIMAEVYREISNEKMLACGFQQFRV